MLRKAQRLDPGGKEEKRIESLIALTEAKLLIQDRRPDRFLLERAVELDPTNQEAKDLLASFEAKAVEQKQSDKKRFITAGAIFGGMLVGVLLVGFVGRRKKPAATKPDEKRADAKSPAAPAPEAKPSAAGEQKPDEPMARLPAPPSG